MSKREAGQWWFPNTAKPGQSAQHQAVFAVGYDSDGNVVLQMADKGSFDAWSSLDGWHHDPRCTGWDWVVPEEPAPPANQPDPDEWVEITNPKHVLRRDIDFTNTAMLDIWEPIFAWHGDTIERVHCWGYKNSRFRCRRRDLPPVEQPEQWPKYYATLDSSDSPIAYVKRPHRNQKVFVRKDGIEVAIDGWSEADDERTEITEAEAMALLKKPEPQPAKTRVRLWLEGPTKMIMCRDKAPYGDWQEIHHDAEGFYVVEMIVLKEKEVSDDDLS